MTGFDETVPPDDDIERDEQAVSAQDVMPEHSSPEHDSTAPAFEDELDPDELPRGQYGPTADYTHGG